MEMKALVSAFLTDFLIDIFLMNVSSHWLSDGKNIGALNDLKILCAGTNTQTRLNGCLCVERDNLVGWETTHLSESLHWDSGCFRIVGSETLGRLVLRCEGV